MITGLGGARHHGVRRGDEPTTVHVLIAESRRVLSTPRIVIERTRRLPQPARPRRPRRRAARSLPHRPRSSDEGPDGDRRSPHRSRAAEDGPARRHAPRTRSGLEKGHRRTTEGPPRPRGRGLVRGGVRGPRVLDGASRTSPPSSGTSRSTTSTAGSSRSRTGSSASSASSGCSTPSSTTSPPPARCARRSPTTVASGPRGSTSSAPGPRSDVTIPDGLHADILDALAIGGAPPAAARAVRRARRLTSRDRVRGVTDTQRLRRHAADISSPPHTPEPRPPRGGPGLRACSGRRAYSAAATSGVSGTGVGLASPRKVKVADSGACLVTPLSSVSGSQPSTSTSTI